MPMKCPACGFGTAVIDRKVLTDAGNIIRRRGCRGCGYRFKTVERVLCEPEETNEK